MDINLDEHQMKAVKHFKGPALVVAGPGSGKTRVIIERILNLIREYNVNPNKILALAFNKEAAKEMNQRVFPKLRMIHSLGKPDIRTLHSFGLEIIRQYYRQLKLKSPPDVWGNDPHKSIRKEIEGLKREADESPITVYIYKIGNKVTDKCYIGQTTNWERRKQEHINDSSNTELHQEILTQGVEQFNFKVIREIKGKFADSCETEWIEYYKNLAVFNQKKENVCLETDENDQSVAIFKIESNASGRCYIGYSSNPKRIEDDLTLVQNDQLRQAIKNEGIRQFSFDIIFEDIPITKASERVAHEIEIRKNMAVYNKSHPLSQRYSNKLQVELFCEHFNLSYEEVVKHPTDIKNLSDKIENYEKIVRDVEKVKLEVAEDFSNYNSIENIINFILGSINDIVVKAFAEKYEKKKKEANAIDFQDMILYAVYLFERYPNIRANYCEKYDYVLVDEFQDISPIDFRLIKTLSTNLFAVGDDDQAIYSFRGGDSEIMQDFHKNVKEYRITKNYRSTVTVVNHSKTLIDHNQSRIQKSLNADKTTKHPIRVYETTKETETPNTDFSFNSLTENKQINNNQSSQQVTTLENILNMELTNSTREKTAILVRYRSEVDQVRNILKRLDFEEKVGSDRLLEKGGPYNFIGIGNQQIRVSTIHSVKGKEYDKVILIHNTLGEDFPFHDSDNMAEERRVFYVAMTRAIDDLVIIGGECLFVWELRKAHIPELERSSNSLKSAIEHRINEFKRQLSSTSEVLPSKINNRLQTTGKQVDIVFRTLFLALEAQLARQKEVVTKNVRKQHASTLEKLRKDATKTENLIKDIEIELPKKIKKTREEFLKDLITIFDQLDSIRKKINEKDERHSLPSELEESYQKFSIAHEHLSDLLKSNSIQTIDTTGKRFDSNKHVSFKTSYSNDVPKGIIIDELSPGYQIDHKVIQKARVIVSKGLEPLATKRSTKLIITQDYSQSVIVMTYKGCFYFTSIKLLSDRITGIDRRGYKINCQKVDVLFILPNEYWDEVKPYLFINSSIKDQKLRPSKQGHEIQLKYDTLLRDAYVVANVTDENEHNYILQITTRAGYVLKGFLLDYDREVLHISMGGKTVIIYLHGVLEIKLESTIQQMSDNNSTNVQTNTLSSDDSKRTTHTFDYDDSNLVLDTETHSKILREQIHKLETNLEQLPSKTEQIITVTDHDQKDQKIESEISKEKHATSPTNQDINKNLKHYLRKIYNFVIGNRN